MKELVKYILPYIIIFIAPIIAASIFNVRLGGQGVGILTSIAAAYYLNLDNPHHAYKKSTIIALATWIISVYLRNWLDLGSWLPALAAGVLVYVYFQRFRARNEKLWVDYFKLAGVIVLLPTNYFPDTTPFVCTYLASIYLLDRFIIRRQMNKTTQIIAFCLMGLLCLSMLVYSFIKADEAEKAKIMADQQRIEAMKFRDEAERQKKAAEHAASEARRQAALAEQIKEDCESSK